MKYFIVIAALIFSATCLFAQNKNVVTAHYKVEGICEQCKKRIEDAAYIKGVKKAEWNQSTRELTIIYRPSRTSPEAILASVAKAGHDNELFKASDEDYDKIHVCCKYRTLKPHQ